MSYLQYYPDYSTGPSYNQVIYITFITDSGAEEEPVTLQEAKDFCRISVDEDDTLITELITAARMMCEGYSNIGFIYRGITATVNNGNGGIYLPYGPINEVTEIDGEDPQTGDVKGSTWVQLMVLGERIEVMYTAGYTVLPKALKTALLNAIYYLYENRAEATDGIGEIAMKLLSPYKRP
jgi:hypothetical protein